MNQRERDQKKKRRAKEVRKKVLARREEIRKQRKEEERLEKEFEAKELKNLSNQEIKERLEHNYKILEVLAEEMEKKELAFKQQQEQLTPQSEESEKTS